jgi:2-polyprenyl-3-methyl-5-hydroxy-6-metoxy-1,4-benzoquinol methylase
MDKQEYSIEYSKKDSSYFSLPRTEILPFVPQDAKRVLDVGCSAGYFGEALKAERPDTEVWGVEPNREAANLAKERLDNVINGLFDVAMPELAGQTFDAVVFNDVLEHLPDPERVLRDIRQILRPNGFVVASIPNILHFYQIMEILLEQDWRYRESGILDNTHLRFFTRKSIERMFSECGYSIERIEGINPSYGLKYQAMNLLLLGRLRDWKYIQFAVCARAL